ncbi:MAG: hypothetical protein GXN92_00025 [Candidatus Micrarchaeota archaeon]|nr:hypothetical protein [Candidatus Micrarchaeota archaeon]
MQDKKNMQVFEHYWADGTLKVQSAKELEELAQAIARGLEMEIVSGPYVFEGKEGNEGYTVLAGIEFSSITIHHFFNGNRIFVDVLTCKPTSQETFLSILREQGISLLRWGSNNRSF